VHTCNLFVVWLSKVEEPTDNETSRCLILLRRNPRNLRSCARLVAIVGYAFRLPLSLITALSMYDLTHLLSHLHRSEICLVLDVGANAGQFALEMFNSGFTGRIISFEPLSSAHAALSEAARNNPSWEVAPRCALGATVGSRVINIAGNSFSSSLRPMLERHLAAAPESAYIGTETVPVETLADLIAQRFPDGAPRFALKIDTQGFEGDVLDGLGAHIEHCMAVLLEMPLAPLYGDASDLPTLFARLVKCNFCCVGLSPGHKNTRTGDAIEVDGLFVRDVSAKRTVFPLFTSIPPRLSCEALAQQREVIASWRATGFEPISVNGPSEIAPLKVLGLDIEVEPAPEDGKPFVADIAAAIRRRGCERAGIVNADCEVIGYPGLALKLAAALDNSVLYAERVDVGEGRLPTVGECQGFDVFFFDVRVLGIINDRHFRLGETWWDYWFPLQLAVNGAKLGNIGAPLILHRRHQARWSEEQWVRHARHMFATLKEWSAQNTLPPFLSSLDFIHHSETSDVHQLSTIGAACFQWLRARKLPHEESFLPNDMGRIEALLQYAYRSFSNSVNLAAETAKLAAATTELPAAKAEGAVAKANAEAAAAKAELAAVRASTSWRLTRPLRQVVSLVRYGEARLSG
jgi:FkbM family methyltransferase